MNKPQPLDQKEVTQNEPLTFEVAPHIVQDLGLNLYTSLPRVLVEFVANAYDADSPDVEISLDKQQISAARRVVKQEWELEKAKAVVNKNPKDVLPLEERTLPPEIQIIINDHGHGMSRDDLQNKFLIAGRRRREEEGKPDSEGGRILMGRKGLGKLAGFGVAHTVTVISRKKGEDQATRVTLDYEALIQKKRAQDVPIANETLADGGDIEPHGTKIILSKLVYEPMKSEIDTIANAIGDHFSIIENDDFKITLNGTTVTPTPRDFVYAWPTPEWHPTRLVDHSYQTDEERTVTFRYRIRFTGSHKQLNARERGVRIYAHKRLAAAPDLLDLKTGIHGFKNTHYLDGIVYADFIDDNPTVDYVATDRQNLRWESSLLAPMREFLTKEMEIACNEYQKKRDADAQQEAEEDTFTKDLIENSKLPKHRKRLAYRVAGMLASISSGGTNSKEYKTRLPIFLDGLGQGDILKGLHDLAMKDHPDFDRLVSQVTELTARELGDFMRIVQGRLDGIEALKKLYKDVDFKKSKNEGQLHELFEKSPWLIDPTFTQFLTSDEAENEVNKRLSKYLEIGSHTANGYDSSKKEETEPLGTNKRPDLVFVLSNEGLHRLIIVELKAPNTPLHKDHLDQLEGYIRRTAQWLKNQGGDKEKYKIEGYLIGSKAEPKSKAEKVEALQYSIDSYMDKSNWRVFDIGEILERTKKAHNELLEVYSRASGESY